MFDEHFEVFLADTPESKAIHYSIRYQVYCEEMGFEDKNAFPSQQESDEYDNDSIHFIIRHKHSDAWIGAMRLIFKRSALLPLEKNCALTEHIELSNFYHSVELSRLCLVKEIRRRITDKIPPVGISDIEQDTTINKVNIKSFRKQRKNPSIIWGLLRAATEYGHENDIKHCFFLTTNALARIIRKGGLGMLNIGAPCNHNGERFPFKMNVAETYSSPIWQDYKNSYRLYSELTSFENQKAA
ncbi:MAG: PEP-CTERM/exosortase system-associated acyltransferase [Methylococcaceae bacterium]|jgi:N-acyl amino acid synthase of PEP-CTERM/exosortase system